MEETQGQSELGSEKRRHESFPLQTASRSPSMSVTLSSEPYRGKMGNNEHDELGEELNN